MPNPNVSLRRLRKRAALSMEELAELAGVSLATVSRIESGNRYGTPETLTALATALGVAPDEIGGPITAAK